MTEEELLLDLAYKTAVAAFLDKAKAEAVVERDAAIRAASAAGVSRRKCAVAAKLTPGRIQQIMDGGQPSPGGTM